MKGGAPRWDAPLRYFVVNGMSSRLSRHQSTPQLPARAAPAGTEIERGLALVATVAGAVREGVDDPAAIPKPSARPRFVIGGVGALALSPESRR